MFFTSKTWHDVCFSRGTRQQGGLKSQARIEPMIKSSASSQPTPASALFRILSAGIFSFFCITHAYPAYPIEVHALDENLSPIDKSHDSPFIKIKHRISRQQCDRIFNSCLDDCDYQYVHGRKSPGWHQRCQVVCEIKRDDCYRKSSNF
jgi:hypothetical protein